MVAWKRKACAAMGRRWVASVRCVSRLCAPCCAAMLSAAPARAADPALIAAARQEGQVTWYTSQIVNQFGRPAMEAFQKRYGIRVNSVRADSVELPACSTKRRPAGCRPTYSTAPPMHPPSSAPAWPSNGCPSAPRNGRRNTGTRKAIGLPPTPMCIRPPTTPIWCPRAASRAAGTICSRPNGRERWPGSPMRHLPAHRVSSALCWRNWAKSPARPICASSPGRTSSGSAARPAPRSINP